MKPRWAFRTGQRCCPHHLCHHLLLRRIPCRQVCEPPPIFLGACGGSVLFFDSFCHVFPDEPRSDCRDQPDSSDSGYMCRRRNHRRDGQLTTVKAAAHCDFLSCVRRLCLSALITVFFFHSVNMNLLNPDLVHFFYHKPNSVLFHRLAFCWKVV